MDRAQVNFELFFRRHRRVPWTLALATEERDAAYEAANDLASVHRDGAVRLCEETRDPGTGEFQPLVLRERGTRPEPNRPRWKARLRRPQAEPVRAACSQPQDLYGTPARQAIGRHLAGWLGRNGVTPFELLHRADLAERLEACPSDLSNALSNAALEQAGGGAGMDKVRLALDILARRAIDRITHGDPDPGYQLGAMVAGRLGCCEGWNEKIEVLLDMLDTATGDGLAAQMAMRLLQRPLLDILGAHGDLAELFPGPLDPGDQLLALLQVALAPKVAAAAAESAALARMLRPLRGMAARLALVLHTQPILERTRWAMVRRVLTALTDEALLWPSDPDREIEGLRALGALLSRAGRQADANDVAEALANRWRRVVQPELIDARLALCAGSMDQATVLLDLVDEAAGKTPVAALGRRLSALLASPDFARELGACWNNDERQKRLAGIAQRAEQLPPDQLRAIRGRVYSLTAREVHQT